MPASTESKEVLPLTLLRKEFKDFQHWLYIIIKTQFPWLGKSLKFNSSDRVVLEDIIIPYFVTNNKFQKILFVGCDWYTKPYQTYFKEKEYWTIEIDKNKSKYGSEKHIVDGVQNLSKYVKNDYLDLIIFNGVFGWGLNSKEDTEETFQQFFQCLSPGGILVFGWNDVPQFRPFPVIEECQNLKKFEPYSFPSLSTTQYLTPNNQLRHTFNFYIKPVISEK